MRNESHSYKSIHKMLPALLILSAIYTALTPEIVFGALENSTAVLIESAGAVQDDFDGKFREGRDLIDKEEWARAAARFREAVEKYPDNKSADAALYWLAFCHKKQKQFKEADQALDRLLTRFSASTWAADARVMKMEIAAALGQFYSANVAATSPTGGAGSNSSSTSPANAAKGDYGQQTQDFYESLTLGKTNFGARTPLDRQDEIKLAAFQSLLAADPKRAIEAMGEILTSNSKASEVFKQEVLRVVRNRRLWRTEARSAQTIGFGTDSIGGEYAPALREILMKNFRSETNPKIRREIIYTLAGWGDQTVDYLKRLYALAESDKETKKAIITSFSTSGNAFYGFNLRAAQPSPATKQTDAPRQQTGKVEQEFLLEIVRTEKDTELRRLAFANLRRFQNWASGEQAASEIARLYEAETDEEFKISLVHALAESKQTTAHRKLMNIARNDRSDKLRLEAIYALRNSKDPEVLKFLEDLIK